MVKDGDDSDLGRSPHIYNGAAFPQGSHGTEQQCGVHTIDLESLRRCEIQ